VYLNTTNNYFRNIIFSLSYNVQQRLNVKNINKNISKECGLNKLLFPQITDNLSLVFSAVLGDYKLYTSQVHELFHLKKTVKTFTMTCFFSSMN